TAWRMPDYRIGLLFIGNVALKWIAAVTVLLSLLNIPGENAGGNIAHLGGAFVGMAYGIAMARGRDITRPINMLIDGCVDVWRRLTATKINRAANAAGNRTAGRSADRVDMDAILDKIKKSGYASLTADERQRLFDVSRKIK
ncbi:MAG: rhomboid family intramembrane serine protease, partial [Muribaculaceae bacterium]|nr:rhomboid family intramembrane serine protease [Muribaculaceae bacterium]